MCLAAGDILTETWQQYVELTHIAISDVSVERGRSLW